MKEGKPATSAGISQGAEQQPAQRLNRALYLLILAAFFLPFATVKSCAGKEGQSYTGFELAQKELGALLVGVLLLAVLLFAFSFRRRILTTMRRGWAQAIKALLCALALVTTVLATSMTFLFSPVSGQIGFILCVGAWLVLFLLSMKAAIHDVFLARCGCREPPPPWGLALGTLLVAVDLITVWMSQPHGTGEVVLGLLASLLLGAPLILMAMLLAVRYRLVRS